MEIKNHGFIAPEIKPDHYVLGVGLIPEVELQPTGQWIDYLPGGEKQANGGFESCGCSVFATNNCIEILKRRISVEENYSDRFGAIITETTCPGNDPHKVIEVFRKTGLVKETSLPFRNDITTSEKFLSLENKDESLFAEATEWLKRFTLGHEWVWTGQITAENRQQRMMDALKLSPLGVSVCAWKMDDSGFMFKNEGDQDNHWTVCVGYKEGEYWLIYDTYPTTEGSFLKKLRWEYPFGFCKRYHLSEIVVIKPLTEVCTDWFTKLINRLISLFV